MNRTAQLMFDVHTHAEIVNEQNPDQIVYREKDVIEILRKFGVPAPVFDGKINIKSVEDQIQDELNQEFSDRFKKIWVQRARYSLMVTVIFNDGNYTFRSGMNIYDGLGQQTRLEDARDLVIKIINGE